jgi:simple sugar transport system ATP-binding protein
VLLRRVEGKATPGEPMLQVKDLRVAAGGKELVAGLDLDVRRSEIYGLAGVEGNGQAELVEALVGLVTPDTGRIYLDDDELTRADVRTRRQAGLAYIPEDRHARGMVLQMLVSENSVLGQQEREPFSRRGLLDIGATQFVWQELVEARDEGVAVLLISSNLEEILALADRVGVIYDGRIVAQFRGAEATMSELGLYMTGARGGGDEEPAA